MSEKDGARRKEAPLERILREIVYATACEYEGHASSCNRYDCRAHDHPEVKTVRRLLALFRIEVRREAQRKMREALR